MREFWKPVPGYGGMYLVSNKGRIRSLRFWKQRGNASRGRSHLIKATLTSNGYRFACFHLNGCVKRISLAKLVLLVFVGPPVGPRKWACHNDGNPLNNWVTNLRWGTNSENQMDRVLHGTSNRGSANGKAKLNEADVISIHSRLAKGESQASIAAHFRVDQSAISNISRGRNWPHLHPSLTM